MPHESPRTEQIFSTTGWRRASLCGPNGGNCVEVNLTTPGHVGVRDSKRLTGDVQLRFDPSTWARFLAETRLGTFDQD